VCRKSQDTTITRTQDRLSGRPSTTVHGTAVPGTVVPGTGVPSTGRVGFHSASRVGLAVFCLLRFITRLRRIRASTDVGIVLSFDLCCTHVYEGHTLFNYEYLHITF
jgi:hypothetical protein